MNVREVARAFSAAQDKFNTTFGLDHNFGRCCQRQHTRPLLK